MDAIDIAIQVSRVYSITVKMEIAHSRDDESPDAKAAWFQSLPLSERMEIFCSFTDLALENNPRLPDLKDAQQTQGRVRVLSST
jgi:hypothetical protein